MTAEQRRQLRSLEGQTVSLALADGSRLDEVSLVSAGSTTVWIFTGGQDAFVPVSQVIDVWVTEVLRSAA